MEEKVYLRKPASTSQKQVVYITEVYVFPQIPGEIVSVVIHWKKNADSGPDNELAGEKLDFLSKPTQN